MGEIYNEKIVLVILFVVLTSSPAFAAKKKVLDFQETEGQTPRMESGLEVIESNLEMTSVRIIAPQYKFKKRGSIQVIVFNASGEPFNMGPENVSARLSDGTEIPIITYEQLAKEEKKRQTWMAIAAGLTAMSNSLAASQAGNSYGSYNYSGTTYGSYGSYYHYGSGTYSSYNAGAAYAAQSLANLQNQQRFEMLAESNRAAWEALKVNMRTTTVGPGTGFGGSLVFEIPKSGRKAKEPVSVQFTVEIAGERHVFVGTLFRPKKK